MIESGSLTPGVSADDFGLRPGLGLRIELPAPALRPFVDHYHVLASDPAYWDGVLSWALPSPPIIRFVFDGAVVTRLGNRIYHEMPAAALYGFTSRAREVRSHGGVTVGAALTPLGWARLTPMPADRLRDQIVPLTQVVAADAIERTASRLRASSFGPGVKAILDEFLHPLFARAAPMEEEIATLMAVLADDDVHDIATASERAGMSSTQLRRSSTRHFGSPPKTLLVQTRFMRSLWRMLEAGHPPDYSQISPTYFDKSHFLRDASRFLGLTPRRFMAQQQHYLLAVARALALVRAADVGETPGA